MLDHFSIDSFFLILQNCVSPLPETSQTLGAAASISQRFSTHNQFNVTLINMFSPILNSETKTLIASHSNLLLTFTCVKIVSHNF